MKKMNKRKSDPIKKEALFLPDGLVRAANAAIP
jgi:hypothetical protein